jgi:flagellar motor switch protein FliM
LAPNEAVVAVGVEVRIGDTVGMMNIAMPSIVIKMMRQKFDQQWSVRKTQPSEAEQARLLRVLRSSRFTLEGRLSGAVLTVDDLLALSEGKLLALDYPVDRPVELLINGAVRFAGRVVAAGNKRGFLIEAIKPLGPQGMSNEDAGEGGSAGPPG